EDLEVGRRVAAVQPDVEAAGAHLAAARHLADRPAEQLRVEPLGRLDVRHAQLDVRGLAGHQRSPAGSSRLAWAPRRTVASAARAAAAAAAAAAASAASVRAGVVSERRSTAMAEPWA